MFLKIMFFIIALFVFMVGLSEIIHSCKLSLLNSGNSKNIVTLCFLYDEFAELDLQYIIEQSKWSGKRYSNKVLCINEITSPEILDICTIIANKNGIRLINKEDLCKLL